MAFALIKADKVFLDFLRVRDQNLPEFASLKSSSHRGGRKRILPEAIGPRDRFTDQTETDKRWCLHARRSQAPFSKSQKEVST